MIFLLVFIIIPLLLNYYVKKSNENLLSDYLGEVIGVIVSGYIAIYTTRQQIKANRHDNFNNEINFNNYKELNNLLNSAFKEISLILKIDSSVAALIKEPSNIGVDKGEYIITKHLSSYNKIFPQIINFCNSYVMKLKSITGSSLDMSKPIKDLNTFENIIKDRTDNGNNTIYNDINIIFSLDKQIANIHSINNTNYTFKYFSPSNEKFPQYDPSDLLQKQDNYLKSLKKKIKKLLKILTKLTNDIKNIRDNNIKTLMKR